MTIAEIKELFSYYEDNGGKIICGPILEVIRDASDFPEMNEEIFAESENDIELEHIKTTFKLFVIPKMEDSEDALFYLSDFIVNKATAAASIDCYNSFTIYLGIIYEALETLKEMLE